MENKQQSRADLLKIVQDQQATFPVGQRHAYSNTNYLLLGLLLEKITGEKWQDYLQSKVFAPAGMKNTSIKPATAPLYYLDQTLQAGEPINSSLAFSAGALTATPQDLIAFYQAFSQDRLLNKATRQLMSQPVFPESGYGLGVMSFAVGDEHGGTRYLGHHGRTLTSVSRFVFDGAGDCALVIMQTPVRALDVRSVEKQLLKACRTGEHLKPLQKRAQVTLSEIYKRQLPGTYMLEDKALEIVKTQISTELRSRLIVCRFDWNQVS